MRTRSSTPIISLLAAAVLTIGAIGPALAQDESPSPAALPSPAAPAVDEGLAERPAERKAAREERRVERAAKLAERKAERRIAKDERKAAREERKAARDERKATRSGIRTAWRSARENCRAELAAIRADEGLDRAERKVAWREAKAACRSAFLAARESFTADAPIDELYSDAAADPSDVVRTDLGLAEPASAPDHQLGLWHYLIPAGQELAPHTHPGWQLARVTDGELEYTVVEGEAVLLRADGSSEPVGPGTYLLATGDGVIENPELVHLGANRTDEPVTLISATLFETGEEIATVVGEAAGE